MTTNIRKYRLDGDRKLGRRDISLEYPQAKFRDERVVSESDLFESLSVDELLAVAKTLGPQ